MVVAKLIFDIRLIVFITFGTFHPTSESLISTPRPLHTRNYTTVRPGYLRRRQGRMADHLRRGNTEQQGGNTLGTNISRVCPFLPLGDASEAVWWNRKNLSGDVDLTCT